MEDYSDTFIKRSEFSTNEEITTNRPSTGQNIALELNAMVDIVIGSYLDGTKKLGRCFIIIRAKIEKIVNFENLV